MMHRSHTNDKAHFSLATDAGRAALSGSWTRCPTLPHATPPPRTTTPTTCLQRC